VTCNTYPRGFGKSVVGFIRENSLEELQELGMCYCCLKETNDMEHGLCRECRE
jgi:hypothetical protein